MAWRIYDYVHPTSGNLMRQWAAGLEKKEKAKLDFKIDALETHGSELIPGMVSPTGVPSVFKLKVQGQVKLRPMLCQGPGDSTSFTFLLGAKEIQDDYDPAGAPDIAATYRTHLVSNPRQREAHERSNRET